MLRLIVLSVLLCITSFGSLACTVTGTLRDNFYRADTTYSIKRPLRVLLIPHSTSAPQRFKAEAWDGHIFPIDIALESGVMHAMKDGLATVFESVDLLPADRQAEPGQFDAIAFVRFRLDYRGHGPGPYWTEEQFDARMEVRLEDAQSRAMIATFDRSSLVNYTRAPIPKLAGWLSFVPAPIVLWPITVPWIQHAKLSYARKFLETNIGALVRKVSDDISNSQELVAFAKVRDSNWQNRVKLAEVPAARAPTRSAIPFSDVDTLPAVRTAPRKNAHALVIGLEKYRGQLPKASFADSDATLMAKYLTHVMGYAEENVAVLLNDQATKSDLEKYIESWLPNRVEQGDTVFVYFSGHGAPNPKTGDSYLVPYDGDPTFIDKTGYSLHHLYQQLAKLPAQEVVVMLDSCFSGAGGRSVIAEGMRPFVVEMKNPLLTTGNTLVLSAGTGLQVSSTYTQKNHGLLTYFFLKGLQGEADTNKDGAIALKELFDYLGPQVERVARREFNNEQTPQLLGSAELLGRGVQLVR